MESIIQLLKERNHFLKKFSELNEKELTNFGEGNFENLNWFYNSREKMLSILGHLDKMIEEKCGIEAETVPTQTAHKRDVIRELDFKNELITQILSQDLQALSFIEKAKSEIIKELSSLQTSKKAVSSYKSGKRRTKIDEKY